MSSNLAFSPLGATKGVREKKKKNQPRVVFFNGLPITPKSYVQH